MQLSYMRPYASTLRTQENVIFRITINSIPHENRRTGGLFYIWTAKRIGVKVNSSLQRELSVPLFLVKGFERHVLRKIFGLV